MTKDELRDFVRVVGPRDTVILSSTHVINTTSRSRTGSKALSPFYLGPVQLPTGEVASCVENFWQYSKVYPEHEEDGQPTEAWYRWRAAGFQNPRAVRYPMGKGAVPVCSYMAGQRYGYATARLALYVPAYASTIKARGLLAPLREEVEIARRAGDGRVVLWDFDGYDHVAEGRTLEEVFRDESRKAGHAFVLWGLLVGDPLVARYL